MFFKMSKLEKLLKDSWQTGGLIVGHQKFDSKSGAYVIIGNWWKIWIRDIRMPKELKAAVIKLCGDLPELGDIFRSTKDLENQYELEIGLENIPESFGKCTELLKKSHILWNWCGLKRILQTEDNKIVLLPEYVFELVDFKEIDRDTGEWEPEGPVINPNGSDYVCWGNAECIFKVVRCYPAAGENTEFFEKLSGHKMI